MDGWLSRAWVGVAVLTMGLVMMQSGAVRAADSVTTSNAPIVLELFTSQSCSSCPPADALLAQLAKDPRGIALSCNVTYWNHLSWKDTLSLEACTKRQRAYSAAAGRRSVFTPELMINGSASLVGSDRTAIQAAMAAARGNVAPITITLEVNGGLSIQVPSVTTTGATLSLIPFKKHHREHIARGENRGEELHYTHAVLGILALDPQWRGVAKTYRIPAAQLPVATDGVAVLVNEGSDGAGNIIAAGQVMVR